MSAPRRPRLAHLALVLLGAGCTPGYQLSLVPVTPYNQAPFEGLDALDLVFVPAAGESVQVPLGVPSSGSMPTAEDLPELEATVIQVEGTLDGSVAAWGQTEVLSASEGDVETQVLVTETDAVAWLGDVPDGVARGMLARVGDGQFLLGGGLPDNRTGAATNLVYTLSLAPVDDPPAMIAAGSLPTYADGSGNSHENRILASFTPLTVTGNDEGLVLLVGGSTEHPHNPGDAASTITGDVSLYDPAEGTWTPLAAGDTLETARAEHLALENVQGNLVVWGGWAWIDGSRISWANSVEVYDRAARGFSTAGTSSAVGPVAAAITDLGTEGTLVCGGANYEDYPEWSSSEACLTVTVDGASVTEDASLPLPLAGHAMATLQDGRVLVTGGVSATAVQVGAGPWSAIPEAWVYTPSTGSWNGAGAMTLARAGHAMTVLPNGKVLVAGGSLTWDPIYGEKQDPLSCVELFDPATARFESLDGCGADDDSGALPGRIGRPLLAADPARGVLIVGGYGATGAPSGSVGFYVPAP